MVVMDTDPFTGHDVVWYLPCLLLLYLVPQVLTCKTAISLLVRLLPVPHMSRDMTKPTK